MNGNVKNGRIYGCHVDLLAGETPDDCVIDYNAPEDCVFGHGPTGIARRSKWACKHWKPFKDAPMPLPPNPGSSKD